MTETQISPSLPEHNATTEKWHTVDFLPSSEATPRYKALLADSARLLIEKGDYQLLAEQNPTSDLPNRRVFNRSLSELIETAEKGGDREIGVVFIDLDGFKLVNDTYGHEKGDEVLRNTGKSLQKSVREDDLVVHFGGDEFAVLMPRLFREDTPHQEIDRATFIENLRTRFREAAEAAADEAGVASSASIGVGVYEPGDTPESLTKKADEEMYKDKILGKQAQALRSTH